MRILLVNAVDITDAIEVLFPPLGLAYIGSQLRKSFPEIKIKVVYCDVDREIEKFRPDIIGISSVTQNYNYAKEYARAAKKHGLPVIIGGTHITSLPVTMSEDMDVAVMGEGEETIVEIIEKFYSSNRNIDACKDIPGIAYKENGRVSVTPMRCEITPLDKVPFPARDLMNIPKRGIVHLFSSRGCPYRCLFCASTYFWDKVRFFSADYLIEEIERVVADYNPVTVGFYDDLFIASRKRLFEVAERIIKKGYHRKIEFILNGRANLITDEMAELFKRMNVVTVNMGLESGSPRTLEFLKCGSVTVEANQRAVDILHRHGINTHGTFIIGAPGETEENIRETVSFIRRSKLSSFSVYLLTPYPGTPIWKQADEMGIVANDMDWTKLIQEPHKGNSNKVLMADSVSPEVLYKYYMYLLKLGRRRRLYSRITTALTNPGRLIGAIQKNLTTKHRRVMQGSRMS